MLACCQADTAFQGPVCVQLRYGFVEGSAERRRASPWEDIASSLSGMPAAR